MNTVIITRSKFATYSKTDLKSSSTAPMTGQTNLPTFRLIDNAELKVQKCPIFKMQ